MKKILGDVILILLLWLSLLLRKVGILKTNNGGYRQGTNRV